MSAEDGQRLQDLPDSPATSDDPSVVEFTSALATLGVDEPVLITEPGELLPALADCTSAWSAMGEVDFSDIPSLIKLGKYEMVWCWLPAERDLCAALMMKDIPESISPGEVALAIHLVNSENARTGTAIWLAGKSYAVGVFAATHVGAGEIIDAARLLDLQNRVRAITAKVAKEFISLLLYARRSSLPAARD